MYDPGMKKAVQAAIAGGKDLPTGVAMFVVHMIAKLEEKMGQLSDDDYQQVAAHLCGSLVSLAKDLGDPTAQDTSAIVQQCIQQVMQIYQQQEGEQGPPDEGQGDVDPSQAPPMAQFGGPPQAPQGPPQ